MNKQLYLIILLILILFFRIHSQGGVVKPDGQDPELERVATAYEPYRDFLAGRINEVLPQPQAALLAGILLGVKSNLPKDFSTALRRTSTIHIVVVSGQNLTLLIGFMMSFVSILGRKRTLLISLGLVVFYSLLTGLQIPVLRAAIMVAAALIAQLFGRETESTWVLIITALIMLIYQPDWLLSISFQLSFLATAGVIIVAPVFLKMLSFVPEVLREDLGVSFAAQLLTWPIIAANFHTASLIGVVVNPLVLWTVSLVMIFGIITLVGALLNPILGLILALIPGILLTYFVYIINFCNSLPYASIYLNKTSPLVWIGYYILFTGLFLWLKQKYPLTEQDKKSFKLMQKAG